jgi:hypothetical protein
MCRCDLPGGVTLPLDLVVGLLRLATATTGSFAPAVRFVRFEWIGSASLGSRGSVPILIFRQLGLHRLAQLQFVCCPDRFCKKKATGFVVGFSLRLISVASILPRTK